MKHLVAHLGFLLVAGVAIGSTPALAAGGDMPGDLPYTPVVTPNGSTLPWKMEGGVKAFHLTVEVCKHEVAPGMVINPMRRPPIKSSWFSNPRDE